MRFVLLLLYLAQLRRLTLGIEQDIKQNKPFRTDREKALVNILYTHSWLRDLLNKHFKAFGITEKQYNILRILKGATKPLTTSEIRGRMLDNMSDITRLIDRLILKQFVDKKICATDKRLVDIWITELGKDLLDKIDTKGPQIDSFLDKLTEEKARQLSGLLEELRS